MNAQGAALEERFVVFSRRNEGVRGGPLDLVHGIRNATRYLTHADAMRMLRKLRMTRPTKAKIDGFRVVRVIHRNGEWWAR